MTQAKNKDIELFTLIVDVKSGRLPLLTLSRAVDKFRLLLNELCSEGGIALDKTTWVATSLSMKSPARIKLAAADASTDFNASYLTDTTINGFARLGTHKEKPHGWNDKALRYGRDMSKLADQEWVSAIHIENGHKSTAIVSEVASHVDILVAPKYKASEGSIDGRLDLVNVHEGFDLGIYTSLENRKIPASFEQTDDKTLEKVKNLLKRRVYATGTINWGEDGHPNSIVIKNIELMERDVGQKGILDLHGVDPNFTQGLSVEEFLRRKRGD